MEVGCLLERVIAYLELQERSIPQTVATLRASNADKAVLDCAMWEWRETSMLLGHMKQLRDYVDNERDDDQDAAEVVKNAH